MEYKVDYHIHSWCSDGTMKPSALVRKYHDEGYDIIALTDHDGIDGIEEARIAGEALRISVVPGIELSTSHEGMELHILGYQFDPHNAKLLETLALLRQWRQARNEKLMTALQEMGYALTWEDVKTRPAQTYIGKPNFARALAAKGYVASAKEAFTPGAFLEAPQIKAISRKKLRTADAIALIREAGGIAVLAHPGKVKKLGERNTDAFWQGMDSLLAQLKKAGLGGLECYYPSHSHEETMQFVTLAGKYHLHITEGSDFHGTDLR